MKERKKGVNDEDTNKLFTTEFQRDNIKIADHSGRVIGVMNFLRPFEHWDRGFECHLRHVCLSTFSLCNGLFEGVIPRTRSPTDSLRIKKLK
jgi:hypothetical protein